MTKKKVATKKEKEWMRKVAELGCYACEISTGYWTIAEVHHIRSLKNGSGIGLRPPHSDTIPLCSIHHRTGKDSIHLGKKLFIKLNGTEQEILEIVKRRINNE